MLWKLIFELARHRCVKMKAFVVPREDFTLSPLNKQVNNVSSENLNKSYVLHFLSCTKQACISLTDFYASVVVAPGAAQKIEQVRKELYVIGVSVNNQAVKVGPVGTQKVKEIQVASARGGADVIFNVNLKNWENKKYGFTHKNA